MSLLLLFFIMSFHVSLTLLSRVSVGGGSASWPSSPGLHLLAGTWDGTTSQKTCRQFLLIPMSFSSAFAFLSRQYYKANTFFSTGSSRMPLVHFCTLLVWILNQRWQLSEHQHNVSFSRAFNLSFYVAFNYLIATGRDPGQHRRPQPLNRRHHPGKRHDWLFSLLEAFRLFFFMWGFQLSCTCALTGDAKLASIWQLTSYKSASIILIVANAYQPSNTSSLIQHHHSIKSLRHKTSNADKLAWTHKHYNLKSFSLLKACIKQ